MKIPTARRPWARPAGLLLGAVACGTAAAAATTPTGLLPEVREYRFEVLLDDKPIGHHDFRVSAEGDRETVESQARFDVRVLFVNAFRYRHANVEKWDSNCLHTIDAATDSNGKSRVVRGRSGDDGFVVSANGDETTLPSCVQTFAYWNPAFMEAERLLNSQTGAYQTIEVRSAGVEMIEVGDAAIEANRYEVLVDGSNISLWYTTGDNDWVGLEAPARGKRKLRYRRLPGAAPARLSAVTAEEARGER